MKKRSPRGADTEPDKVLSRSGRRGGSWKAIIVAPIFGAMALVLAPVAHAATYTYANNIPTSDYQARDSGFRSSAYGGMGTTELFSPEGVSPIVSVETYRPYPGYRTIGFASAGGTVNMTHASVTSVHQKCWWYWPWSSGIGSLRLTCAVKY